MSQENGLTVKEYVETYVPKLAEVFLDEDEAYQELQAQGIDLVNSIAAEPLPAPPLGQLIPLPVKIWDLVFD